MLELSIAVAAGMLLVAAVWDFTSRTIPNTLPAVIAASFITAVVAAPDALNLWHALLMGTGLFAAGSGLFALKWLGGGDVKLIAAAGLWSGVDRLDQFLLVTALTGAALGVVIWAQLWIERFSSSGGRLQESKQATVPYGVAIACGGLVVLAGRFEAGVGLP